MMIIKSTNPQFSFVLNKNPETQKTKSEPFKKSLRRGMAYGWFYNDQEFRMLFVDSPTESSFNTLTQFEYLDRTRYSSPYLPIGMINTLLATAQKQSQEADVTGFVNKFICQVELSAVSIAERIAKVINQTGDIEIRMEKKGNSLHTIEFTTTNTIHFMLNYVIAFLITQAVQDENLYIPMDESSVEKYVNALVTIDAPYYMRYITGMKCVRSPVLFEKFNSELNGTRYNMNFGDTQMHRWGTINSVLSDKKKSANLFDIGCGELFYSRRLCGQYSNVYAFDADEELMGKNQNTIQVRGIENITLCGKFDSDSYLPESDNDDVLITEVLEHMTREDANTLLGLLLKNNKFNRIVITMPNRDFNKFYGMEAGQLRHDDHKYEPNREEFVNAVTFNGFNVTFFDAGDTVDGEPSSFGAVITKENNEN